MMTSKPFATISYNSKDFLKSKLDDMLNQGFVDFYSYVEHRKEKDEAKNHIHLFIVPATRTNTNSLLSLLEEKDDKCDKPLKCMPAVSSKFGDWYMYCLHDKRYLLSKGQSREYTYTMDDFVVSDFEYFQDCIHRIDRSKWVGNDTIVDAVENEIPFFELVRLGRIPVQLINQYKTMYDILSSYSVNRNGRDTHTPSVPCLVDPLTGEVNGYEPLDALESPFSCQGTIDD